MPTALITGGAKGIGRALAEKLKKSGYNVVINYFSSVSAAEKLSENGFFTVRADVTNASAVDGMFDVIHKKFGKVNLLINNAGIALKQKTFLDVTEEEYDYLFAVDMKGVFLCTKKAVSDMLSLGGGDVVNVSSVWGVEGASCEAVYAAAKGAVIAFTKSLAKELDGTDICVQAIAPSMVDTDMNAHLSDKDKEDFLSERKVGKILTPDEVADITYDLVKSRESGRVTAIESKENFYSV